MIHAAKVLQNILTRAGEGTSLTRPTLKEECIWSYNNLGGKQYWRFEDNSYAVFDSEDGYSVGADFWAVYDANFPQKGSIK